MIIAPFPKSCGFIPHFFAKNSKDAGILDPLFSIGLNIQYPKIIHCVIIRSTHAIHVNIIGILFRETIASVIGRRPIIP
jgi:hypothetical protein